MAIVLDNVGFPFVDAPRGDAFPTAPEPKQDEVIEQNILLDQSLPISINPVRKKIRPSLVEALTSGGKLEVHRGDGFVHFIGSGAFEAEELQYSPDAVEVVKEFASNLLEDGKRIPSILANEFRETMGISFNKHLFAFMNAAGMAITMYMANSAQSMDWSIQDKQLSNMVNGGLNSIGLEATSSVALAALGLIDFVLPSAAKFKERAEDKDIWRINTAMAAISSAMIALIGKALIEDPTLVQKLVHNILVK